MKRILPIALTLLIFSLGSAAVCEAQKKRRNAAARSARAKVSPLGLKCPEGEPNQPRPEFYKMWIGDITRKAIELPPPEYPSGAKGKVRAEVVIDILDGRLVWARTISGHPLLQQAVSKVICRSRFSSSVFGGPTMKLRGFVTYRFGVR
ncbi:MAG TPA: hypothetical protein VF791_23955 [Pyrinomonadaceae bacterium]